ncbi:Mobilization protein mbeA, partial [Klebsiella aerogenes]|nr:Mobilization protein mbeA [Klebsiella aerogenes]
AAAPVVERQNAKETQRQQERAVEHQKALELERSQWQHHSPSL